MIHTIGSALKECITKSMLKSNRLTNNLLNNYYLIKINLANLMATRIKRGRSSMSLLLINPAGQSDKELSLNGDVSITNSTALSNAFNDHFSTITA